MTKQDKVEKVMHEWKAGTLTSHGKVVTDYDQAVAIALSEAGLSNKYAKGGGVDENTPKVKLATINKIKKLANRIMEIYYLNLGDEDDIYSYSGDLSFKERRKLFEEDRKLSDELTEITDTLSKEQCESIDSENFQALNAGGDFGYEDEDEYAEGGGVGLDDFDALDLPISYRLINNKGEVIFKTNSFNKASDTRTIKSFEGEGKLKIIATDKSGNQKIISDGIDEDGKKYEKGGNMNEYSKGGNVIERRYVNKDEDYEVRYAKDKPMRKGYNDERMFEGGGEMGKKLKGYRVYVFESSLSSSQNVLNGDSYILVTDGVHGDSSEVDSDEVYLKLVKRNLFGKEYIHAEPINVNKRGNQMFGGKFVWSSDSRFREDISEQPIQLHDRVESYALGGGIDGWKGSIFNKYFTTEEAESMLDTLEDNDELNSIDVGYMGEQGLTISVINAYTDRTTSQNPYNLEMGSNTQGRFFIIPLKPMQEMPKQVLNKFAVGGEIGDTVTFSRYGERTTGRITDKLKNGYEVVTDEGTILVEPQEVISFSETPIAKKKRFGFFAGGGSIENQYKGKTPKKVWSEWSIEQKSHFLKDHFLTNTDYSEDKKEQVREAKYLNWYDLPRAVQMEVERHIFMGQYALGGEIENKIEKLKKVVSSKMLPESVKAKAQSEIDKLEKELHESKETKAEEKAEHKAGGKEYKSKLEENLEKELHRLQRDLNSSRLQTYNEGDNSEEEKARQRERTSKIIRMNEVLALLNEIEIGKENKMTGESEGERNVGMDNEARLDEKEELNATIQKLYDIEAKAEDLINYQSGGIQGQSVDKIKKYVEYVNKEVSKLDVPFGSEVYDVLEDENAHSLNLTLGLLGFYKNKRDSGEWAKKYEQYAKVIEVVNEVKGGGKPEAKEKIELRKITQEEWNTKKKHDYASIKDGQKYILTNVNGATVLVPVEIIKSEAKKPTTRKAPVKKAVAKKTEVKKEIKTPSKEIVDYFKSHGKKEAYLYNNRIGFNKGMQSKEQYNVNHDWISKQDEAKPKADHKKLVAKLKAKKGATPSNEPSKGHKRSESSDRKRSALPLGKRVSADGNVYYENRLNRADISKEDKFEKGGEVKGSDWGLNLNW